jgi:hypothetical protein
MVCFRYISVDTLHTGDDGNNHDDDNIIIIIIIIIIIQLVFINVQA